MDTATIIVTTIFSLMIIFKLYSLRKNGIKKTLKRKLVLLPIVAVVVGMFILLNPEYEIKNPKDMLTDFVSSIIEKNGV